MTRSNTGPITLVAAALGGVQSSVTTIGYVTDFDFSRWALHGADTYYQHNGRDFIRLKLDGAPNPEAGGNFSWLFRKPVWEQLLALEACQFGAFQDGDVIRITESLAHATHGMPPRTPCWHTDIVQQFGERAPAPNPHMYLLGSRHAHLNTEIVCGTAKILPDITDLLDPYDADEAPQAPVLLDYLQSLGTRQLGPGEVVRMRLSHPHRTSPFWNEPPAYGYEFSRLKVLRLAR